MIRPNWRGASSHRLLPEIIFGRGVEMGIPASDLVQRQDVCHPSGSRSVHLELPLDFQARDLVAMHLVGPVRQPQQTRSEEHTSELQSPMRRSYAVFCLQKKNK